MASAACPLCAYPSCAVWFELERGRIDRCAGGACGLGFLAEQPDDDQLAAFYEEYYYPEHGGAGVFENSTSSKGEQHFAALDARLTLAGKRLLDYGCGVGVFLDVARRHGVEAEGLEFDDHGRSAAEQRGFRVVKTADQLPPASFDLVYLNDVIEHLRDPVAGLRTIRELLVPGGALFVATMNMRGLKPRVAGAKWDVVTNPTHLWFYDETSLRRTLVEAGYADVEVQRWPVQFDHHGRGRRALQRVLQRTGLDGSLRMLAFRPAT